MVDATSRAVSLLEPDAQVIPTTALPLSAGPQLIFSFIILL